MLAYPPYKSVSKCMSKVALFTHFLPSSPMTYIRIYIHTTRLSMVLLIV